MNISGSAGEPSNKRQENGDASREPERKLKKARFAWQVKGKYHLKNEEIRSGSNEDRNSQNEKDNSISSEHKSSSSNHKGRTEENLEILGDYLLKQDFNTLNSVVTDPDNSQFKSKSVPVPIPVDKAEYPRYISTFESSTHNNVTRSPTNSEVRCIPPTMTILSNYAEDQCIARWQSRQVAKSFVDNTINRILDSWMEGPLPGEVSNNPVLALNVADFINNLPGDNTIENEGILMAISAHGLQNNSSSNDEAPSIDLNRGADIKDDIMFPSPPNSPLLSEDGDQQKDLDKDAVTDHDRSWSFNTLHKDDNNFPFPDTPGSSFQFFPTVEKDTLDPFIDGVDNLNTGDEFCNHFDFMDAAVSFAIQNKGLTSFGTDNG